MVRRLLPAIAVLAFALSISAQPKDANKPAKATADARAAADLEAQRLIRERRANAQSLLISLAADANTYNDQKLRARTLSRIADTLWDMDPERGRTMFRRSWDAAETADAEAQQRIQEDVRQQQAKNGGGGGYVVASPPEIRNEVLRLAAKRDRSLGEEFLAKLKLGETAPTEKRSNDRDSAISQRLGLASQLLAAGDVERAVQFADPVLGTVSTQTLDFLSSLREKNSAAADERYAALLSMTAANPQSDANTASLLSSYLFTPHLYVTFSGGGASTSSTSSNRAPVDAPALRPLFLRVAADILLQPLPQPGTDQSTAALLTRYYVIKRMMPLFEQNAGPEMISALHAQFEALSAMVTEGQHQSQEESVREGILPQKPPENREQSFLDQIDRAKTSGERDSLFYRLARSKADTGDLKARDYADKIEDSELRHMVRSYIDATLAMRAVQQKDPDLALELARTGELSHVQRVWTMTRAARLILKTDRERALLILDDAATEARRMENSDPERACALFAVADALFAIDRARGWEAASEAVKAANGAETFTGEDGQITVRIITKGSRSIHQSGVPEFDVASMFRILAKDDYERSVELARVFQREAPRAHAVLAIAQSVMENKEKPGSN